MESGREESRFLYHCGEVLRNFTNLETLLDNFISTYFCVPRVDKMFVLNDTLLHRRFFSDKIQDFRQICIKLEVDRDRINKIVKALEYLNEVRNDYLLLGSILLPALNHLARSPLIVPLIDKSSVLRRIRGATRLLTQAYSTTCLLRYILLKP